METISQFSSSGVHAVSYKADTASEVKFDHYDLVIITSSWDSRCLTLIDSPLKEVPYAILLTFDDKDPNGVRDKNDSILENYCSHISSVMFTISGLSTDIDSVWSKISERLLDIRNRTNKAISILFDLSCCPRYYAITLMSICYKYGIACKIDYFYNECTYPEKSDVLSQEEIAFTAGKWEAKRIPHLTGRINPGIKNRFTVSIGFEGSKTLMILNEFEPDNVNILIPSPGYTDNYVDRAKEANQELFKSFGVTKQNEIYSYAADPIDVWTKVSVTVKENNGWNDYFLCAGSKPHSLGLALAAFTLQTPSLIYSLPQEHKPVYVTPKSDCWLYSTAYLIVPC